MSRSIVIHTGAGISAGVGGAPFVVATIEVNLDDPGPVYALIGW